MSWSDVMMAARRGEGPLRHARATWRRLLGVRLPMFRPFWGALYVERELRLGRWWPLLAKVIYREPLLRYRCASVGLRLTVEGAIPQIYGDGRISIGEDVVLGGQNTWIVGFPWSPRPSLEIGDRVLVGYRNTFSVALGLRIGDDTIMAPNIQIYDNPSHPLSPSRRLAHDPLRPDECAPVSIGRNVWIGSNATIMRGVTIGDGSVVAAGSIVTRDVPPRTLVAGSPAVVVRELTD